MKRLYTSDDGFKGICYHIENQLEYMHECDEEIEEYLDSLTEDEYRELLSEIAEKLEDYIYLWEDFDSDVSECMEEIMKGVKK